MTSLVWIKSMVPSRLQQHSPLKRVYRIILVGLIGLFSIGLLCVLSGLYFTGYWRLEKALCETGGFFSNGCYEAWAEPLFLAAMGVWFVGLCGLIIYGGRYILRSTID